MAERNQLKVADHHGIAEDDPFAELTRIMGFDPRQPAKPQPPVHAVAAGPVYDAPAHDAFDIDLEKELMGEFCGFDDQPAADPVPAAARQSGFDAAAADDIAASLEQDFRFEDETAAEAPMQAPEQSYDDPGSRMDAHMGHAGYEPEADEATDDTVGRALADEYRLDDLAADDLAAAYDDHRAVREEAYLPRQAAEPYAAEAPLPVAGASEDDFADYFDDAVAAVDMDFSARSPESPEAEAAPADTADGSFAFDDAAFSAPDDGPAMARHADQAAPPVREEARYEPAVAAPEPAAPAPPAHETTLEDELNALLSRMTARPAVAEPFLPAMASAASAPSPHGDEDRAQAAPVPAAEPARQEAEAPADIEAMLLADLQAMDFGHLADEPAAAAHVPAAAVAADVPDVETIDVPERVVALADDLDLPELSFEQDQPETASFDDLDREFTGLLGDINAGEPAPAPMRAVAYDDDLYGGYSRGQASAPAYAAAPATGAAADFDLQQFGGGEQPGAGELDYDPDLDETGVPEFAANEARPRGRGMLVAAVVGAVAVAGGLGAFALSLGGKGSGDAPAIVKADDQPIKVKPENPGGTVIPNQDNKVYDAVGKGVKTAEPQQRKLVTDTEEPMDVAAKQPESRVVDLSAADDAAAQLAPKSEDRVEQAAAPQADGAGEKETPVVTPRKVRTMVVKPDGSLVAREDPTPQVAAAEPADPAPQHVGASAEQTGTVAPAADDAAAEAKPAPAAKAKATSSTPAVAPIAPQRPSDQPLDIVGEVKPDQVAAIDQGTAAGSWSIQIASQPTAEAAQSTYQDLARRYAGVLEGRGVNIVKAEIAGKGTFYRVRVPAKSRNDAVALCTSYKAAGGNCFVSK